MIRLLAAAVGVLLVADVVGIVTIDDGDAAAPQPAATTSTAVPTSLAVATPTTVPDALAVLVRDLQAFVEQHRGLRFSQPLKVALLPEAAFKARVLKLAEEDDAELVRTGNELRALGLLAAGVDLGKARDELLSAAIVGFYDPKTDELVVRGAGITPYVRTTLAHEITHAIQDQNFDINHPDYDEREDEISVGFSAVAEGDALRIEEQYTNSLTKRERQRAAEEEVAAARRIDPGKIPPILSQLLAFPYANGPVLVSAMLRAGGQARVDAAFKAPPTTTEQVMHPDKFLIGEGPKPVADPAADAAVIDKGVVGELVLKLLLSTVLTVADAARVAAGWGGDRYVAWDQGRETCVRVSFAMDSPSDLQELRTGLSQWASKQKAASLSSADPPTLTSCA